MKKCSRCERELPLSDFYARSKAKDGLQAWCKSCSLQSVKKYQAKQGKSIVHRMARYGLTEEEVHAYLHVPICQACGSSFDSESDMRFDHCHQRGHLRGVLCHRCNITCIGDAEEAVIRMEVCIDYLLRDLEREQARAV